MKAIVKQSQDADDLAIQDMPIPSYSDSELLVRVKAIGVGIHDSYFHGKDIQFPYPIGIEASGMIEKMGDYVSGFEIGDRVAFVSMMQPKGGTWAEYAIVDKDALIFRIPDNMTFNEAAAIPVAGNTVLKTLKALDLGPDKTLFIAGASGAIGTFAIQLAKAKGCRVAASASEKNHAYMASLKADKTVDYHDTDWITEVRSWAGGDGVDAAIAIQPDTGADSMATVKSGGKVVTVSGSDLTPERQITVEQVSHQYDVKQDLFDMVNQIADNNMQLTLEHVYSFQEGIDALEKTQTRHARGKAVISVDQ